MIGTAMSLAFYHVPNHPHLRGLNWRLMLGSVRDPVFTGSWWLLTHPAGWRPCAVSHAQVFSIPEVASASAIGCAAATQLLAVLGGPLTLLTRTTMACCAAASLSAVTQANVAEALREAGPQGAHTKDLATACGVDAGKLGRSARSSRGKSSHTDSQRE